MPFTIVFNDGNLSYTSHASCVMVDVGRRIPQNKVSFENLNF